MGSLKPSARSGFVKTFCSFKGYGDFVVACRFLRARPPGEYRILASAHLKAINSALGSPVPVTWVDLAPDKATAKDGFPAIYDLRRQGLVAGARSLLRIREALAESLGADDALVFEWLRSRERLMAWPRRCSQIGRGAHNIYLSYGNFFDCPAVEPWRTASRNPRTLAVFPDARLPHRVLGSGLLKAVISECARRNIDCTILRVGKPGPDDASSNYPVQWIQTFDETVAAINSHDVVVSSDSLPGHIAEYFQAPVFVFTPFRKDYWMPGSTFLRGGFGLFDDPGSLGRWLDKFDDSQAIG